MFRALFDSDIFNIQSVVGLFTGNYHHKNKQLEQCQIYKIPSLARIKQNKNGKRTKETTLSVIVTLIQSMNLNGTNGDDAPTDALHQDHGGGSGRVQTSGSSE